MSVIGVVCEYNPFHRGHLYHLEQARARLGGDTTVVCVLSGDFVQRGEAAVYQKFARAEAACRCGADLVAELPLPWCLSSAEGFARGAVSLLDALEATHLSFGSESDDLDGLWATARVLALPETTERIKALLRQEGSLSFAAARETVVRELLGECAELLRQPNSILAVEYLKALDSLGLDLVPLPVLRQGAGHDQSGSGEGPCSASELRKRLRRGLPLEGEVPPAAATIYARERAAGRELADSAALEIALLSRLRALDPEDFERLPDAGDGLGRRLYHAVQEEADLESILQFAKSKRYALSRLRRMALCAALGVSAETAAGTPPYARVLAFNARGRLLLRKLEGHSSIPILTKPAAARRLGGTTEEIFNLGSRAHDLYVLGLPEGLSQRPGADWRTGPVILD